MSLCENLKTRGTREEYWYEPCNFSAVYRYVQLMRNKDDHSYAIVSKNICREHSEIPGNRAYRYPRNHILLRMNGDLYI
tara:strand:+ start:82 stop:318 length:237 start_codon:yes stop_codon:yes gene_type:complete